MQPQTERTTASGWTGALARAVALAAFVSVVAIVLLYILHFARTALNSDDAVFSLLAGVMSEQGRVLPEGWIYINGDLWMPSITLIIASLLHWMPNGFHVHSIANLAAIAAVLWSLVWLMRVLRMPWPVVICIATLVASGPSLLFAYQVYVQTSYLLWPLGFLIGAALIARYRLADPIMPVMRWRTPLLLFVVIFLVSFSNPARVLVTTLLSLYLLDRAFAYVPATKAQPSGHRARRLVGFNDPVILVMGLGFLCALALYQALRWSGATETVYGAAGIHWGGWAAIRGHAGIIAHGWLPSLGMEVGAKTWLAGVPWMARLGIAIGLTCAGLIEIWRLRVQRDPVRRAFTAAFVGALAPVLVMCLVFDPLAIDFGTMRYFVVALISLVLLGAFQLCDFVKAAPRAAPIALAAFGVVLVSVAAQRFLPVAALGTDQFWTVAKSPGMRLAEAVQREGLRWGYASWWNAGVTTVMTDSRVQVSPVELDPGGASPGRFMTLREWYRPERWLGETFLALTTNEADKTRMAALTTQLGAPSRSFDTSGYRVLVYDHNIAKDFACSFSTLMNQPIAAQSPTVRLIGAELGALANDSVYVATVHLRNEGDFPVSGDGRYPLSIGMQLLDQAGASVKPDWLHARLRCPLQPGEERLIKVALPSAPAGSWRVRVDIVQEGVTWFRQRGMKTVDLPLAISPMPREVSSPTTVRPNRE